MTGVFIYVKCVFKRLEAVPWLKHLVSSILPRWPGSNPRQSEWGFGGQCDTMSGFSPST